MRTRTLWVALLMYLVTGHTQPAMAQVDQQPAQEYFKDVQAVCEREGLRLWGLSLCGPMVSPTCGRKRSPPASPHRKGFARKSSAL